VRNALGFLRSKIFGSWSDGLASLSFLITFLALLVTLFLVEYPGKIPQYIVLRDLCIVFGLIGIIIFLLLKYFHRETIAHHREELMHRQLQSLSNQFINSHNLVHNYRNELFKSYYRYLGPIHLNKEEKWLFYRICGAVTDYTRKSLIDYFNSQDINIGEDVSVSVKLIIAGESIMDEIPDLTAAQKANIQSENGWKEKKWIITVYRDSYTFRYHEQREKHRIIYDMSANTVYYHILNRGFPFFVENDLQARGEAYEDANPRWKEEYNALQAAPIRYKDENSPQYIYYGLLVADSLNEERRELYNDKETRYILGHAADLLATFFLILTMSEQKPLTKWTSVHEGAEKANP
jgi:hypothetical protein